jgi:hypothetical protein
MLDGGVTVNSWYTPVPAGRLSTPSSVPSREVEVVVVVELESCQTALDGVSTPSHFQRRFTGPAAPIST